MVTVHIPIAFRGLSGGRDKVDVEGGGSLRTVIQRLDDDCPGIEERLILEGDIHPGIAIFIDDEQTSEGLISRVPKDGSIFILPAMGGGSLA